MKKIAKLKKNQFFESLKEKKLEQVRMENRKMSEDLQRVFLKIFRVKKTLNLS